MTRPSGLRPSRRRPDVTPHVERDLRTVGTVFAVPTTMRHSPPRLRSRAGVSTVDWLVGLLLFLAVLAWAAGTVGYHLWSAHRQVRREGTP